MEDEYKPLIENNRFYLEYKDHAKKLHKVEVSEDIFLQFFGIHKRKEKKYFILYQEANYCMEKEVTVENYKNFQSFKSIYIKEQNIYDRYTEHFELDERVIYQRMEDKHQNDIVDKIYRDILCEKLRNEIDLLSDIQKRRLLLYFYDEYTMREIAEMEHCSPASVKRSLDRAIQILQKKLIHMG